MNDKKSPFQIILFAILVIAIVAGVLIFSMQRQKQTNTNDPVTIWGTLSQDVFSAYLNQINEANRDSIKASYKEFEVDKFETALVEALASGTGPDMVIMKDDWLVRHENKLYTVGYDYLPQKMYKETFIEAGDILLKPNGISGFPFIIDPLVMYYNRATLNSAGISFAPKYWDEFLKVVPGLVRKDSSFNISKSAVALGEFRNIKNAKEILVTLTAQAGNQIVTRNFDTQNQNVGRFIVNLDGRNGFAVAPADAALNYYTQFSNPSKTLYSWNRALPNSDEMFLSGNLAFYFGLASEYFTIQRKNPNLNYDVAVLPQSRSSDGKFTYGDLYFIGIINNSKFISSALGAADVLTNSGNLMLLANILNLPPVRRDLLVEQNSNAVLQNFNLSALIAKPFIDPDSAKTTKIFSDMVESYTSGRSLISEAIERAQSELNQINFE